MTAPVMQINTLYAPANGSFGLIRRLKVPPHSEVCEWEICRDTFQDHNVKNFFFSHRGESKWVINFIERIQDIMKLRGKHRLIIGETANKWVVYLKLSKFWRKKERRSILTAFLRAGQFYTDRNKYKTAMKSIDYLRNTMPAVKRFLAGYTEMRNKYLKDFSGWHDELHSMNKKAMINALKKPKRKN